MNSIESKVRLFLSVDICGSTNLKNTSSYSSILAFCKESKDVVNNVIKNHNSKHSNFNEEDIYNVVCEQSVHKDWSVIIKEAFKDFNVTFASFLELTVLYPWKSAGDELLYCFEVKNRKDIYKYVLAFYKTLRSLDKKYSKESNIRLKGAAWTAGFPVRNREISIPMPELYKKNGENDYVLYPYPHLDFLGQEMDAGFRLSKCTYSGFIVISIELAFFLSDDRACSEDNKRFSIYNVGWEELKGVWANRKYPVLWLDLPGCDINTDNFYYQIYTVWDKEDNECLKKYDELKTNKKCIVLADIEKIITQLPESLGITKPYIVTDNDIIPEKHKELLQFIEYIKNKEKESRAIGKDMDTCPDTNIEQVLDFAVQQFETAEKSKDSDKKE